MKCRIPWSVLCGLVFLFIFVLGCRNDLPQAPSRGVEVGVADTSVKAGGEVEVRVLCANIPAQTMAFDLWLEYDRRVLEAKEIKADSLPPGWNLVSNIQTPGVIRIAAYSIDQAMAQGQKDFVTIVFKAKETAAGTESAIQVKTAMVNGEVVSQFKTGKIAIK